MKLLPHILSRAAVVRAELLPDGTCRVCAHTVCRGAVAEAEWAAVKGLPAVVVVVGQGVVTRPGDAEIVARVQADAETFLWSSAGGSVSFMRRERLHPVTEALGEQKIVPVRIFCADAETDFGVVAAECVRQFYSELSWKSLLRPSEEGSALGQAVVRRLALPVLGGFLVLLAVNAFAGPGLNARRGELRAALAATEQARTQTASADERQRRMLAEFAASPVRSRAVVCDRIARAVPAVVRLTALEVEPLAKRFEAGKPLERRTGMIVASGRAPAAADVSLFVERLSAEPACRRVRLAGMEREREGGGLQFRVEIEL